MVLKCQFPFSVVAVYKTVYLFLLLSLFPFSQCFFSFSLPLTPLSLPHSFQTKFLLFFSLSLPLLQLPALIAETRHTSPHQGHAIGTLVCMCLSVCVPGAAVTVGPHGVAGCDTTHVPLSAPQRKRKEGRGG